MKAASAPTSGNLSIFSEFMQAVRQIGLFWAAVEQSPIVLSPDPYD
jgi:hypothetical protein